GGLAELLRPGRSLAEALRRVDGLRRHVVASRADVGALLARLTQFGPHAPREAVEHVVALAGRAPSRVWTNGLPSLLGADLRDALARVGVPALVVVGDHDRVTPRAAAEALARALPDAELAVLAGAGHVPMLERPEALNGLIDRFAARVLGGEGPA
ncbi:MAG TPA: alpha/beta hydrolase, partial [Actinomycetota bacterium]|nr:alpha/beta hydrolase [Actinomycetota bacterium]